MRRPFLLIFCGLSILTVGVRPGTAQTEGPPDTSKARVRIGPLYLNPTISLTNLGRDNNVFNEPDQQSPKSDVTATVTPASSIWLRLGPMWVIGNVRDDLLWYQTYASERANNQTYSFDLLAPLNRLTLRGGATYLHVRDRPGFEIDERSARAQWDPHAAIEWRAFSKTYVGVKASRRVVEFDSAATFEGVRLQDALNRKETTQGITVRNQLTPLTSISFSGSHQEDRFDFAPMRDTTSNTFGVTVTFDPLALIKGSATIGYRDFKPSSPTVPGFRGTTTSVDLSYVLAGSTKVSGQIGRDVQYSFELQAPYYVQTGGSVSLAQQIFGPLDAVVRGGVQRLSYSESTVLAAGTARTDRVYSYGGGVGYHFGENVRFGFNIDNQKRSTILAARAYNGLRYGFAVTYGS